LARATVECPPGTFVIDYIAPTAEDLDKVSAAVHAASKKSPLNGGLYEAPRPAVAHHRDVQVVDPALFHDPRAATGCPSIVRVPMMDPV
jgi:hypothetical protein